MDNLYDHGEENLEQGINNIDQTFNLDEATSAQNHDPVNLLLDMIEDLYYLLKYDDPLKYVHLYEMQDSILGNQELEFVKPHYVEGYTRSDGTHVDGYYRDGDGDTSINRSVEEGGGFYRHD